MRYLIVTIIFCIHAIASNANGKVIEVTKNPDINYVTVTLPQGIQFPVPKAWQNMTPLRGMIEDYLNKQFDQNYDTVGRLGFAAKGFDEKGNIIGQVTLSFLKNETFGQKAFSQASDEAFEQLAKQVERLNRKGAKLAGAEYLIYKPHRVIINGDFYHQIISYRRQTDQNGKIQEFVVVNLRYYDFENSYSLFVSYPASIYEVMEKKAGKIYKDLKNIKF